MEKMKNVRAKHLWIFIGVAILLKIVLLVFKDLVTDVFGIDFFGGFMMLIELSYFVAFLWLIYLGIRSLTTKKSQ